MLKALDTVAKLRDFATASLQKSLADGPFTGSLATAHLAGVDSKLVQKAQHERLGCFEVRKTTMAIELAYYDKCVDQISHGFWEILLSNLIYFCVVIV